MPPRVGTRAPLAAADALLLSSSRTAAATNTLQNCAFSTTQCREKSSAARRKMYSWIHSQRGQALANNSGPGTLTGEPDIPFPNNPLFRSEPVVNDQTKRFIYQRATQEGVALKAIAAEMGLDVRRVAAIVRLKEAQKQWTNSVSFLRFASFLLLHQHARMMKLLFINFSISLEDIKMVTLLRLTAAPSSTLIQHAHTFLLEL